MPIIAFIVAILAGVLFLVEFLQTRSIIAAGLAALTAAWILELTVSGSLVHG